MAKKVFKTTLTLIITTIIITVIFFVIKSITAVSYSDLAFCFAIGLALAAVLCRNSKSVFGAGLNRMPYFNNSADLLDATKEQHDSGNFAERFKKVTVSMVSIVLILFAILFFVISWIT